MRRAMDIGIGLSAGFLLALLILPFRDDKAPSVQPETRMSDEPSGQPERSGIRDTPPQGRDTTALEVPPGDRTRQIEDPANEPAIIGELLGKSPSIEAPSTEEETARLIDVVARGSEKERIDAIFRLGLAAWNADDAEPIATQALERAARADSSESVRATSLRYLWHLPGDAFDLCLERLLSDPSQTVKRMLIKLANETALAKDYEDLLMARISRRYSREELQYVDRNRRRKLVNALGQLTDVPESTRSVAKDIRRMLQN